jgi:hypothetical protein
MTPAPDDLTDDERQQLLLWHMKRWPRAFHLDNGRVDMKGLARFLNGEIEQCLTHHRFRGTLGASWYAGVQQWVRRTHNRDGFSKYEPRSGSGPRKPFQQPSRPMRKAAVADVLSLFGKEE